MKRRDESECALIERAIELAVTHHRGQRDRAGEPYVLHVLRIMLAGHAQGFDSEMLAAAAMHDLIEDTDLTLADLRELGMPPRVVDLVDAMTRPEDEPYDAYIRRVSTVQDAPAIKFLDLADNTAGLHRLPTEEASPLFAKYHGGRRLLEELVAKENNVGS